MTMEKQILDYREPFNAPYMIREIAKNINLPFVVYAQDFTVATISFSLIFVTLLVLFGMNQLTVTISIAIPYGLVQVFNRIEPDGKRADVFIKDYLLYSLTFLLKNKVLYHGNIIHSKQEKVVYDSCKMTTLTIKNSNRKNQQRK